MKGKRLQPADIKPSLQGALVWSPAVGQRAAFTGTVVEVFVNRFPRGRTVRWLHVRDNAGRDWHRDAGDCIELIGSVTE